jgi:hypothetical protein
MYIINIKVPLIKSYTVPECSFCEKPNRAYNVNNLVIIKTGVEGTWGKK